MVAENKGVVRRLQWVMLAMVVCLTDAGAWRCQCWLDSEGL